MESIDPGLFEEWNALRNFDPTTYPGVKEAEEANDKASRARWLAQQGLDTARKSRGAGKQQRIADAQLVYDSTQAVLEQTSAALAEVMVEPNRVKYDMGQSLLCNTVSAFVVSDFKFVQTVGTGIIEKGTRHYEPTEYEVVVYDYVDEPQQGVWAVDRGSQRISFRGARSDASLSFRVSALSPDGFLNGSVVPDEEWGMSADVTLDNGWRRPWQVQVNWGTMRMDNVAQSRRMMEVHQTAVEFGEFLEAVFAPVIGVKEDED